MKARTRAGSDAVSARAHNEPFDFERQAVERLCNLLGYTATDYSNPNTPVVQSGADVEIWLNGSRIGVQVTVYHADEGQVPVAGSPLRADEEGKAKHALKSGSPVKAYGHWASANYIPALSRRVKDKVDKARARPNTDFDELWLLVCAEIPRWGGTGSTMISPAVVGLDDLNAHIAPILNGEPFSRAFLLIWLEGVVYGWTSEGGAWHVLRDAAVPVRDDNKRLADIAFNHDNAPEPWLRDPEGSFANAIQEVLAEFKGRES
jgi:hypothetical protein